MSMPRATPFIPRRRPGPPSRLKPLAFAGANPGNLAASVYVPQTSAVRPSLVVVLHGCTQDAAGYDHGAGWSALADRHGFLLLFPEQRRENNANLCFNWFEPGDTARGQGEVASIRGMIAQMVAEHDIDTDRIFVTGLSAGGAMAAAMLATYPELFAAGAVIGGLPFGCAASVPEALERMRSGSPSTGAELAHAVRAASPQAGKWPRLSVWHGSTDRTVAPANSEALVRQWLTLQGLPDEPTRVERTGNHARRVWCGSDGAELIEDNLIAGMGHGTPLAAGDGEDRCGTAGAYMLDVGISSSHAIARFFGILDAAPRREREPTPERPASTTPAPLPRRLELIGRSPPAATGVQGIIEGALRSAGLMK